MLPTNHALTQAVQNIESLLQSDDFLTDSFNSKIFRQKLEELLNNHTHHLPKEEQDRVRSEFLGLGPLEHLLQQPETTEIMLQKNQPLGFEKNGTLHRAKDHFLGTFSFDRIFQNLLEKAGMELTVNHPFGDGRWNDFRIHASIPPVTQTPSMTLRRLGHLTVPLEKFFESGQINQEQFQWLTRLITERENILILGPTGCGKTSLLNSLLHFIPDNQRLLILEDTDELQPPNSLSLKLLTRNSMIDQKFDITLSELVRQSLRMRPDRLVMGEVRGGEAKDLLMALATGHKGSLCTMHADNAKQALVRLEMLIQLGAPQWSLSAVRQLIALSLQFAVVMERQGPNRKVQGIYKICGAENFGFLLDQVA